MADSSESQASAAAPAGAALKSSLQALAATLLGIVQTRLELLSIELADEKQRLLGVLVWGAVGILFGGFGLVFLALWVTVLLWDSHRLLALGLFASAFLGLAFWAAWRVRSLLQASAEGALAATLAELEADRQALMAGLSRNDGEAGSHSKEERA